MNIQIPKAVGAAVIAAGLIMALLPTNDITGWLFWVLIVAGIVILVLGKRPEKRASSRQKMEPEIPQPQASAQPEEKASAPEPSVYRRHYTLVGVSFKNKDGTSRQKALRKIAKAQESEDDIIEEWPTISIRQYEYEGEPAIGVYADDTQVGNIARDEVSSILRNKDTVLAYDLWVYGGGEGKYYGAELTIIYNSPVEK